MIDPAVASRKSQVHDWLIFFWRELIAKFKNANDAFRQFNISKTGKFTLHEFNFILDYLCIRFTKQQTKEMFEFLD